MHQYPAQLGASPFGHLRFANCSSPPFVSASLVIDRDKSTASSHCPISSAGESFVAVSHSKSGCALQSIERHGSSRSLVVEKPQQCLNLAYCWLRFRSTEVVNGYHHLIRIENSLFLQTRKSKSPRNQCNTDRCCNDDRRKSSGGQRCGQHHAPYAC